MRSFSRGPIVACVAALFAAGCGASVDDDPGGDVSFSLAAPSELACGVGGLDAAVVAVATTTGVVLFCENIPCDEWQGAITDFARSSYIMTAFGVRNDTTLPGERAVMPLAYAERRFDVEYDDVGIGTLTLEAARLTLNLDVDCDAVDRVRVELTPQTDVRIGYLGALNDIADQCEVYWDTPLFDGYLAPAPADLDCGAAVTINESPLGMQAVEIYGIDAGGYVVAAGQSLTEVKPGTNFLDVALTEVKPPYLVDELVDAGK